ncbi:MAG: LacI family transcriptional regulator [Solirubrobacteraceae bacterium]|nr:LacI family transcriptional regulator [Solirubrobacteraceae bacterium]MEA2139195.1 LacI family transcriptional regulator [Solirubrobacteraceae bacterium]
MKQVAALAGVSLSTVSRVVNGDATVRADLVARVRHAVEVLGYRHNAAASALRRADGLSGSIGLIVEDVANPFFSCVQRGVEEVARERAVLTFAGSSDERPERERLLAESLGARGVDGLIIAPSAGDHSFLLRDRAAGMALVFVDRPGRFIDADAVLTDNAGAAAQAVEHLVAAGHRRIGFLGDRPDLYTARERLRGFESALARHGLATASELARDALARATDAGQATRELLLGDDPPTALFTSRNVVTIAAVRAIHDLGLQRSVALVGFDDVVLGDVVEPGLTVIAQDPLALGRAAAELLFSRLDGFDGPSRRIVLSPRLVARGSGELPAPVATS